MRKNFIIENYWLKISLSLFFLIYFKNNIYFFLLLAIYWFIKLKLKAFFIVVIFFLYFIQFIDFEKHDYIDKVTTINKKYILIDDAIVYSDNIYLYGTIIKVEGNLKKLEKRESFYSFDFNNYLINNGINYVIENPKITTLKTSKLFLAKIQNKINSFNFNKKQFLNKIILNQSDNDIFIGMGFCLIGFFKILNIILKKLFFKNTVKIIKYSILILFLILYDYKFVLIRILIMYLLNEFNLNKFDKLGLFITIILIIKCNEFYNYSFWILLVYYSKNIFYLNDLDLIFYVNVIFSIFNNYLNIILSVMYKFLVNIYGLIYIFAIISLFFNINFNQLFTILDKIFTILNNYKIYGNSLGIGLIVVLFIKNKVIKLISYILIMYFSYMHPICEISFINVGQGDSILIKLPFNNGNYLIDTGKKSQYKYLKNFLNAKGINNLEYVFITHDDSDHNGSLDLLKKDFKIKNIIYNFENIEENINIYNINNHKYDNDNDNSMVLLLNINNLSVLLMGDASKKVEQDLLYKYNLNNIDIFKAGHHGSNTSSKKEFIKVINPKLTIFSSGKNNNYSHPHKDVLKLFDNEGLYYLNTAQSGDISIFIISNFKFFYTSDKRIGII